MPRGWNVVCEDESIVVYDSIVKKVWAIKGSNPIVLVTGKHKKTCLFGAVSLDKRQIFRQSKKINQDSFLNFLKEIKKKFKKFVLYMDKAPWHNNKKIEKYLKKQKRCIRVIWFPKYSPELNPVEECWRQSKDSVVGSKFYYKFESMKKEFSSYLRTKKFRLNIVNYLCP